MTHFVRSSVANGLCISHCLPGCRNTKNNFSLQIKTRVLGTVKEHAKTLNNLTLKEKETGIMKVP